MESAVEKIILILLKITYLYIKLYAFHLTQQSKYSVKRGRFQNKLFLCKFNILKFSFSFISYKFWGVTLNNNKNENNHNFTSNSATTVSQRIFQKCRNW